MKLLIDESLPRPLKRHFTGHTTLTVGDCGWASKPDTALLSLAEAEFDALITADRSIEHQQNASHYDIGIIVLRARSNRLVDLIPLVPRMLAAISSIQPGAVVTVAE